MHGRRIVQFLTHFPIPAVLHGINRECFAKLERTEMSRRML